MYKELDDIYQGIKKCRYDPANFQSVEDYKLLAKHLTELAGVRPPSSNEVELHIALEKVIYKGINR